MGEIKRAYLNHMMDLDAKYADTVSEDCRKLGKPKLIHQSIVDSEGLREFGEETGMLHQMETDSNHTQAMAEFVCGLADEGKLIASRKLAAASEIERMIVRQYHYDDTRLWMFEYVTHEILVPTGERLNVTAQFAFPPASVFSGIRYVRLYRICDDRGNVVNLDPQIIAAINHYEIDPGFDPIDYKLGTVTKKMEEEETQDE